MIFVPVIMHDPLVDFHLSTNTSVQNWFLVFWFLHMCSSAPKLFLNYILFVALAPNLLMPSQFGSD